MPVHFFLLLWNAFMASWATKTAVPLDGVGVPVSINATAVVVWVQMHLHVPTGIVVLMTAMINWIVAYCAWHKKNA